MSDSSSKPRHAIAPTRAEDYPEWYQQVIRAADLAELSPVRGCMVIKPWGYAIWERMQAILDGKFKAMGHKNAYFPLFIPLRYFQKEAEHISGFAKECAVVTHSRLEAGEQGQLQPASPLEEPLIVRPTSETIIGEMFAQWIHSYRDLPLKINQWANIVRWEMRTRLFLRTSEFLWQEGHTAHRTAAEAQEETARMLEVYRQFAEEDMAMPVICGEKSPRERFPGAVQTFCIEAMMQDRKALQAGTSHFLGQNFARSSHIAFTDESGQTKLAWTTSWGVSTRLIGALIMAHSDDDGLVLPPQLAPTQVIILPVIHSDASRAPILEYAERLQQDLQQKHFRSSPLRVEVDKRELRGGEKNWEWIKKGVPLRVEVGARDRSNEELTFYRRDRETKARQSLKREIFIPKAAEELEEIQDQLLRRAQIFRDQHLLKIDSRETFYEFFAPQNREKPEIHGGFACTHWNGSSALEEQLQRDLGVTLRCIPLGESGEEEKGICPFSGEPSPRRVIFAKAY
ncbi:MAG: proline--tRNA ligase [Puniceicoccales bacterium]|jgi:prolyl-tRNA synthetase|nr:proline--tRNA ligase [Puniceicoccales bacterium]